MKKFLGNVIIFILLILLVIGLLAVFDMKVIGNQYTQSYQAALNDKVDLLTSINEPKIILAGNSNICFGIQSEMIEKEFKMPVVDLGLHGGLGNAFHEEIAKLNIHKGDILILCHSNFSDEDNIGDLALAWTTLENNYRLWNIIRLRDYPDMLCAYPNYIYNSCLLWLSGAGNPPESEPYSRDSFNRYGDIAVRPEDAACKPDEMFRDNPIHVPEINKTCIDRINQYNKYIQSQGATLLVAGYPIGDGKYTPQKSEYKTFQAELAAQLDCEVISDYTNYFIPYKYFYNTVLHLTEEGARIRTQQLIEDLKHWMKQDITPPG